jgi:hypothetical protein
LRTGSFGARAKEKSDAAPFAGALFQLIGLARFA